jgi:hypothetical protein
MASKRDRVAKRACRLPQRSRWAAFATVSLMHYTATMTNTYPIERSTMAPILPIPLGRLMHCLLTRRR